MTFFKSNENIRKKEDGWYYVISANKLLKYKSISSDFVKKVNLCFYI